MANRIPRYFLRTLFLLKSALLAAVLAFTVPQAHADKPAVIRIGVAQQGAGDPPTFGGSPAATVQQLQVLEKEFAADGIKVEWLFFKGGGPLSTKRSPTSRSTSRFSAICRPYLAAQTD